MIKKLLKWGIIGFFGLIGIFFLIGVFVAFTTDTQSNNDAKEEIVSAKDIKAAEEKAAEEKRISDSIATAKRSEALNELKNFRTEKDDFEGLVFYQDNRTPAYTNRNFVYPYIGEKQDRYFLRLKFQYTADDWLFITQIKVKTDYNDYDLKANFERDHNSVIWEWYDMPARESEIKMLRDIALSKNPKIRYIGTQYHKDRNLTAKEQAIIKRTLDIYESL